MRRRRPVRTLLAAALLGLASTVLGAGPAQAAGETTLTADPLSTWQTDGIVWALAYVKGVVYVGGTFGNIRPPGTSPGNSRELPRRNFAAFDADTGQPLPCAPAFTGGSGTVRALKASPDGEVLYIGGSFGSAGGVGRSNTAGLDTDDCTIDDDWRPTVSSTVRAIDVTDTTVYLGGQFSTVQGQPRERVAALRRDSTLLPFRAVIEGSSIPNDTTPGINAITVAPQLNKVIIGGRFTSVNGSLLNSVHGLVGLDATTGEIVHRFTGWIPRRSAVKALVNDGTNFYLGAEGTGGGVFDGRATGRLSDGELLWKDTCLGATQAVVPWKGVLYSGSHAHNCSSTPGGFPEHNNRQHLLAQSIADETILPWFPDTNDGIGEQIGPRAMVMAEAEGILWTGGEFTTVNDRPQQGLTRFAEHPDTEAPQVPILSGTSASPGEITLSWRASWDRDDGTLTYRIHRDGTYLASVEAESRHWDRPTITFTDTVEPGATHRYSLEVTDGTNLSGRNGPVYVTAGN
ncbi:fibronectin type III domain-containing protein [Streptomyces sp. TRM 70361]|uniref:fibronectin type III domain-containing protein n=1 Tax=Streptomyces sp. TRM 70361 TaxID=3116553 RepID=UPI002E7C1C04|nr:fibronectin type III domain-containing protein [Streptomyces sp. TRM 70361]MEE1940349.1 fibronectin type III domain-containing protein [Streptomyces sp. TRM 70361]